MSRDSLTLKTSDLVDTHGYLLSEQGEREGEATTLALSSLTPCLPAGREGSIGENRQFVY